MDLWLKISICYDKEGPYRDGHFNKIRPFKLIALSIFIYELPVTTFCTRRPHHHRDLIFFKQAKLPFCQLFIYTIFPFPLFFSTSRDVFGFPFHFVTISTHTSPVCLDAGSAVVADPLEILTMNAKWSKCWLPPRWLAAG